MWLARCSAAASILSNRSRLVPGAGIARPIPRGDLFIPGALIQGPDRLFDLAVSDDQEPPPLHIAAARRTDPRFQNLPDQIVRHRVWFQPPHRSGGPDDL